MIDKLTPEQEAAIPVVRDYWIGKVTQKTDKDAALEVVRYLYKAINRDFPEDNVHFVGSPKSAQELANKLNGTTGEVYEYAKRGGIYDYDWVAFYSYWIDHTELDHEDFREYRDLVDKACMYDSICFDKACIIVTNPSKIYRGENNRLHNPDGPAIVFEDDEENSDYFFWNGVEVPRKLIMEPESVTGEDIRSVESNLELRRCYREKLGAEVYYSLLGDKLKVIDEDVDDQGNNMVLYEVNDKLINKTFQILNVICPSTGRSYDIYPTKECTNVWDAKASSFGDRKIKYRHGDVGIAEVGKDYDRPLSET